MTLTQSVEQLTALVESELTEIVTSRDMPLYRMMSYHMGWVEAEGHPGGAFSAGRIHGVLCLLACNAAGGDIDVAKPAAAAVELVHNFCQIHDDVQAGSPQRNNRDAVWWVWGPAQAINAGDGMHALARLSLFGLKKNGMSSAMTFRAVQILDESSLRTCEGRFLDLEAQERIDMTVDAYLNMASSKTGALVSCAMKLGALAASADEEVLDAMGTFGLKLGIAMQIRDDLAEFWGDGRESPVPSTEAMNKKKLLPSVYALEKASISEKRKLGDIYFKRVLEPADVDKLREVFEELGVREDCQQLINRYRADAVAALDATGISAEGRAEIESYSEPLIA